MTAIFKREFKSNFTNMTGYVLCTFILLFAGIFTMVLNLSGGYPNFEYVPNNMCFIFIIVMPILTMRVFAEERRQHTDQLLYSLPISMTRIVLGKYFALIATLAIPIAIITLYPLGLSLIGTIYLKLGLTTLLAFFLLGAALAAIGMFISSLTENMVVAAGICFVVMLLNFYISTLASYLPTGSFASLLAFAAVVLIIGLIMWLMTKNSVASLIFTFAAEGVLMICYVIWKSSFESLFPTIVRQLSVFDRFSTFVSGVFDVTGIIYFLSVIAIFVFLTVQVLEKRRWN